MRGRVLAAGFLVFLGGAALAAGLARPAGRTVVRAAETITVKQGSPVQSTTMLDPTHKYQLVVSGTVSYWCPSSDPSSCFWPAALPPPAPPHPSIELAGVDALYCYATWRCPTPQLWRPLQVNGMGLDQFAGEEGKIPYSGSNTYTVTVTGISGALSFADMAATPTGFFTVQLTDLTPASPASGPIGGSAHKHLRVNVVEKNYNPTQVTITWNATVTICNQDPFYQYPFSYSPAAAYTTLIHEREAGELTPAWYLPVPRSTRGPHPGRRLLAPVGHPGSCGTFRVRNTSGHVLTLKFFDAIHSGAKMTLTIEPKPSG